MQPAGCAALEALQRAGCAAQWLCRLPAAQPVGCATRWLCKLQAVQPAGCVPAGCAACRLCAYRLCSLPAVRRVAVQPATGAALLAM